MSSSGKPKIYLAGPDVFYPNAVARGEELKALCTLHGAIGLFPLDNEITSVELGSHAMAAAIRTANMKLISSADAILANVRMFLCHS
jgi:nucleoside 2-deoxyribosyltransferase